MKRLLALLLCCAVLLNGCVSRQLEDELMVIVLGVDAEENDVILTVKVPSAASSVQKDESGGYLTYSARGQGFAEALSMLRAATPRKLNFTQVREIVLGREAARGTLLPLLVLIDAVPRLRSSAALIVCTDTAKAMIAAQKPDLGVRLSRYADSTLAESAGKGFTPDADLCGALRDLKGGQADPLLILGAIQAGETPSPNAPDVLDALPGDLPRQGSGAIELFGAAATDGERVTGYLTGREMALIHLIQGNIRFFPYTAASGALLRITAESPARLTVDLSDAPARLAVALHCFVHCPPGDPPDPDALADALRQEILGCLMHLRALRCDALGFGSIASRQFLTLDEWESMDWKGVYISAEFNVTVSVRCLAD